MKTYGEWNRDATWRRVVSFTPQQLQLRYPLDRRLCGPQEPVWTRIKCVTTFSAFWNLDMSVWSSPRVSTCLAASSLCLMFLNMWSVLLFWHTVPDLPLRSYKTRIQSNSFTVNIPHALTVWKHTTIKMSQYTFCSSTIQIWEGICMKITQYSFLFIKDWRSSYFILVNPYFVRELWSWWGRSVIFSILSWKY
jgi:hypothetical protein